MYEHVLCFDSRKSHGEVISDFARFLAVSRGLPRVSRGLNQPQNLAKIPLTSVIVGEIFLRF